MLFLYCTYYDIEYLLFLMVICIIVEYSFCVNS